MIVHGVVEGFAMTLTAGPDVPQSLARSGWVQGGWCFFDEPL